MVGGCTGWKLERGLWRALGATGRLEFLLRVKDNALGNSQEEICVWKEYSGGQLMDGLSVKSKKSKVGGLGPNSR